MDQLKSQIAKSVDKKVCNLSTHYSTINLFGFVECMVFHITLEYIIDQSLGGFFPPNQCSGEFLDPLPHLVTLDNSMNLTINCQTGARCISGA